MIKKASNIILILVFICMVKTSFWITAAFLGEDLWVNLYNNIDSGIVELEWDEYSYEMKWQNPSWKIEDPLNKVLSQKWYWDCQIWEAISQDDISKISSGNLELLSTKLSKSCFNWETSIHTSRINNLHSEIKSYKNKVQERAIEKAKQTYNISRIGLYADGDAYNSPFDIIQDIQDINAIVFTQSIEYTWETPINDWWFSDYLSGKFKDFTNTLSENVEVWIETIEDTENVLEEIIEQNEENFISEWDIIQDDAILTNISPIPFYWEDHTQYACVDNVATSWLSQEYLDSLWIYSTTKETITDKSILSQFDENDYDWFSQEDWIKDIDDQIALLDTNYKPVNDNSVWDCSNFFCITVDFITSQHSAFGWEKMNSIQSIIETSNGHLKKFVNTSLIQSKMTTNNFELPLRDLKLSEIFSFGMVITKKTPPIIDIDKSEYEKNDDNSLSAKNILTKRFESSWVNYRRQNDLQIFTDSDAEAKSIIDSWDLTVVQAAQKFAERQAQQEAELLRNDMITKAIQRDAWLKETEELYVEFLEVERFVASIQDYSNDLSQLVRVLNKIPIHQ